LSYLGAFTKGFRDSEVEKWKNMLTSEDVLFTPAANLKTTLGDPIQVQSWTKAELPSDEFTVENTVIMHNTNKFTLSIDPQNQANGFIQRMNTNVLQRAMLKLQAISSTPDQDMKKLKLAVKSGYVVLIENVQESINTALEPLLNKQIVTKGKNFFEICLDNEDIE